MRTLETRDHPSERLLRACALFGVGVRRARSRPVADAALARAVRAALGPGRIVLIAGPSGAGKSTLLRAVAAKPCAERRGVRRDQTLIDALPGTLPHALRALAGAGLGDALLLGRHAAELSEGERFRFGLARALASRRRVVVIDEFASVLDRAAARGVCRALRRWATRSRTAVLCATAHDDVREWLCPDEMFVLPIPGATGQPVLGLTRAGGQ